MKPGHQAGHSLLELLAVITILAVLASMAMASYQNHIRKARRADAKSVLLQTALFMERNYTETNSYNELPNGNTLDNSKLPHDEAPIDGNTTFYDIQFMGSPTTHTYTIEAAPKNAQLKDTLCTTLRIVQAGEKSIDGGTGSVGECWAR